MVPDREGNAHQLPGAISAVKCIAKEQTNHSILLRMDNITATSYTGRHSLPSAKSNNKRLMAVVQEQEHHTESCSPGREAQRSSD